MLIQINSEYSKVERRIASGEFPSKPQQEAEWRRCHKRAAAIVAPHVPDLNKRYCSTFKSGLVVDRHVQ